MSHSKGIFSGTCPGNFRKSGRPHEVGGQMTQQLKCGRCGRLKNKRVRPCFIFHQYENSGKADHGNQKRKCVKCGNKDTARLNGCGILRRCQFHKCDKTTGLHCRRCGKGHG